MTLDSLENYSVPLEASIFNWYFMDEEKQLPAKEHQDQIFSLTKEAAQFLWDYEMKLGLQCSAKYFKTIEVFDSRFVDQQGIKKYLYELGIPFDQKVFIAMQPDTGFVMTWKMVIKYAHTIFFGNDQVIWDKTLNWRLEFHHDGDFTFGRDLIYDGQMEIMKNKEKLATALKEMQARKERNNFEK